MSEQNGDANLKICDGCGEEKECKDFEDATLCEDCLEEDDEYDRVSAGRDNNWQ